MKRVNFWKTLFFTALAAAVFAGCSNDDSDDGGTSGMPSITVDGKENVTLGIDLAGGETASVEVVSSGDWTLTFSGTDTEDCTAIPASGSKGTTSVKFSLGDRTADRTITATLVTYGTIAGVSGVQIPAKATITIMQNAGGSTEVKTNVAEIRALLKEMNPTESSTAVTAEIAAMTITGIVVSDGAGNNLANQYQIAVQDAGTDANSGLLMNATMFGESTKVTPGQVLTATLKNAKVQLKNGAVQLGLNDDEIQLTAGTAPEPIVITPSQLGDYEGQFVRIENCQSELDFVGKAWNSGDKDSGGNSGNVTFELLDESATFLVFSSSYASYCKSIVPEKSGYIQGIATQYKGTLEVNPRFAADLEGLTAEYQGPEYKTGTISQIAAGEYWEITGSIVAVNTSSFLLADASGYVLVYNSSWTTQTSNTYEIGQKVTVKGKIEQFPEKVGLLQFASPKITEEGNETFNPGEPTVFDAAALTAYESDMKYQYVKLSGVLSITEGESSTTGKYYSYTVAVNGYNGKTVTLAYAFNKDFEGFENGDVVDVTGFASGTNFDKSAINIIMTSIAKNTSTPAVTITTTPTTFKADGGTQDIAFTVANPGSNKVYAKVEGEGFSVPSGVVTSPVTVTAEANEGAAREATLTIYAAASEGGAAVAQATVTLKQSALQTGDDTKGTYTSMPGMLPTSDNSTNGYYAEEATINGTKNISVLKFGTSKKSGVFETAAVGVSGNKKLSFYAAAWKGKSVTLYVRVNGGGSVSPASVDLTGNDGASGNEPYTITFSDDTDYYTLDLTDLTEASTLTFSTSATFDTAGSNRALVAGIQIY